MITKFKIYENNAEPKIGDYANVKGTAEIGIINDIIKKENDRTCYIIEYDNIEGLDSKYDVWKTEDDKHEYVAYLDEIDFSNSQEELELLIQSRKYNL